PQKPEVLQLLANQEPLLQIPIIKIKLPIQHLQKTKNKKQKPTKILTTQNTQTIKTQLHLTPYPYQQPLNQL
ncbi:hypothetical protein, partial [Staphylococcus epidermidis]|uniref:hypothetical protein n=1 Tax=Staphylococcus epidermidis TaxID=1282 RepID=UPI001C9316C6